MASYINNSECVLYIHVCMYMYSLKFIKSKEKDIYICVCMNPCIHVFEFNYIQKKTPKKTGCP